MKLVSIELVGYKRFALNQIHTFRMEPTERDQIVLGTNGSGKSSLLDEISPLSGDSSEYTKDGSKETIWKHNGHLYILKNTFDGGNKHSFKKDGEELNPGGTGTAQKTLIWQEFYYSQDIHNLVTGKEKFTSMSPARRREWFTRLSDVDYSYAIEVYNRIKERVRDTGGAIKLAKKRLVSESAGVIPAEEEEALREELRAVNDVLEVMFQNNHPYKREEMEQVLSGARTKHVLLVELLRKMTNIQPVIEMSSKYKSIDDIDSRINHLNTTLTTVEAEIAILTEEDEKVQESINLLRRADASDIDDLRRKVSEIEAEIEDCAKARRTSLKITDAVSEIAAYTSVKEILKDIFENIPDNTERKFTSDMFEQLKAERFSAVDRKSVIDARISSLSAKLAHAEEHTKLGDVACPKCSHRFNPGLVVDKNAAADVIEKATAERKEIEKKLVDLDAAIIEFDQYRKQYGDFTRCFRNNPALSNLNEFIYESKYLTDSPRRFLPVMEDIGHDFEVEQYVLGLKEKLRDVLELISRSEELNGASLASLEARSKELQERLEGCVSKRTLTAKLRGQLQDDRRAITGVLNNVAEMEKTIADIETLTRDNINQTTRKIYSELTTGLQAISGSKARAIYTIDQQKAIVNDLEKNINTLILEEEAAKMLLAELSPTEGLIAEGLLNFIRVFTAQMNFLIRKIWSYPLQIFECGSSDETGAELNYKFPLMVRAKDNMKADVSDGSTAMQEIVNLVFRVTAMNYLGLSDGILSLDEFGASFDEVHRASASEMVKSLLEQQNFSQLFMVSHYLASYGSFQNAEVCVLCLSNITIPAKNFNNHVKIIS